MSKVNITIDELRAICKAGVNDKASVALCLEWGEAASSYATELREAAQAVVEAKRAISTSPASGISLAGLPVLRGAIDALAAILPE